MPKVEIGTRYNQGKERLSLILEASNAIKGMSNVLEFGMQKYSRGNYLKGLPHTEIVDSLLRHLTAYMSGEDLDQDSGLPHVDHVATNALFLAEITKRHKQLEDRSIEVLNEVKT